MKGTTRSRGFTSTLWLRARYCSVWSANLEGEIKLIKLTDYERKNNITRAKSETLLKYHHLFCTHFKGVYWVVENPEDPPTEEMFRKRQRRVFRRRKCRGVFKSELEYYKRDNEKRRVETSSIKTKQVIHMPT